MKIIDSYVSRSFIKNYAISFMVLVGMYVVLDMVFNFNNLVQFQATGNAFQTFLETMRDICDYYFYQCFLFFVQLSGIIPVVAAAFTLRAIHLSFFASDEGTPAPHRSGPGEKAAHLDPISLPEKAGAVLLVGATVLVGLKPDLLFDWINPALQSPLFQSVLKGGSQ